MSDGEGQKQRSKQQADGKQTADDQIAAYACAADDAVAFAAGAKRCRDEHGKQQRGKRKAEDGHDHGFAQCIKRSHIESDGENERIAHTDENIGIRLPAAGPGACGAAQPDTHAQQEGKTIAAGDKYCMGDDPLAAGIEDCTAGRQIDQQR